MGRYTGIPCPVCGKPFAGEDDVVVCPECGTPHHRECYREQGQCAYAGRHGEGFSFEMPSPQEERPAVVRCPRCGTDNPAGREACEVCGTSLAPPVEPPRPEFQGGGQAPPTYGYGAGFGPQVVFGPFGGVNPEEEIDGIPAQEMALFVGPSAFYYLPRFKEMEKGGNGGFSWSGAVISFLYFLYRKVYLVAILSVVLSLCLHLPSTYYVAKAWREVMDEAGISMSLQDQAALSDEELLDQAQQMNGLLTQVTRTESYATASRLQSWMSLLAFGVCLFFGFFANRIYKGHVVRSIRKLKARYPDREQYRAMLEKKGGVNKAGVFVLLGGYFLLQVLATFFLLFI
ncbi:MAG: DUF2628 domain-containing protein [Oscillospiraceae bacterium]|jgi:hypothetical protein|nr:DUF2628 domain-containing protein [Oscillospiraceae bacterium]